MRCFALAALSLLVLAACGSSSDDPDTATSSTSGSTTASGTGGGGTSSSSGAGGGGPIGGDRPVTVYVPPSYDPGTPAPLVILLHGYTVTGAVQELYFQLEPEADKRGFLYAHPDGTLDSTDENFWNATDACCNIYGSTVDDSAYLKLVIDDIKAAYNVDPKQVYFLGHSNGGFMSHRMACDHAGDIAAFVSLAGSNFSDVSKCTPSEPVAMLQIHGTVDDTILYDGGNIVGNPYPGAVASVEFWATLDGCSLVAATGPNKDLESALAGDESTVTIYGDGCDPGGHAELWTMTGGGHIPALSTGFSPAMMDFLFAHPKP